MGMKACVLALLATSALLAADDRQLALSLKAQTDFDRVELTPRPRIPEAEACVQSQAAALSVSSPEERSLLSYRKGYCAFAGAVATHHTRQFLAPRPSSTRPSRLGRALAQEPEEYTARARVSGAARVRRDRPISRRSSRE